MSKILIFTILLFTFLYYKNSPSIFDSKTNHSVEVDNKIKKAAGNLGEEGLANVATQNRTDQKEVYIEAAKSPQNYVLPKISTPQNQIKKISQRLVALEKELERFQTSQNDTDPEALKWLSQQHSKIERVRNYLHQLKLKRLRQSLVRGGTR